jgi:hypothetical protein
MPAADDIACGVLNMKPVCAAGDSLITAPDFAK